MRNVSSVSAAAQAILERIKAPPLEELKEVCEGLQQIEARRAAWEQQQAKLRDMQTRHAGGGLLKKLLEERAKERARG